MQNCFKTLLTKTSVNAEMFENIHLDIKSQVKKFLHYAKGKNIDGMLEIHADVTTQISDQEKIEGHDNIKAACSSYSAPSQSFHYYSLLDK